MTAGEIDVPRAEHLAWCKQRALEYVDQGDLTSALASFGSDMGKHEGTTGPAVATLIATEGMRCVITGDAHAMRRFIEGFN